MDNKTLGEYIRELRDKKDLSLREFAQKLGDLSASFLSDIELGRRYPSEKVLTNMAKVLGVSADELKKYDNRPPIEDMKRRILQNPGYSIAFRRVIDSGYSPDELNKMFEKNKPKKK
jgi:transcriptional regulator with XRE-family HTH domain